MELNEVKKTNKENKSIVVSIRVTPEISEWMDENNVSPSKVFTKAIQELKEKQ